MIDALIQLALAVSSLSALAMAMSTSASFRKWAPVVGLLGQPFWIAYALGSNAWGLLAVAVAFTVVYATGAWAQWTA